MSDEQQKEIRPTKRFGSIQQQREAVEEFQTIGPKEKTMPTDTVTRQPDVKASASGEEMKRQTVYMPQKLATRLKIHAATIDDDISGIITRLVEDYLNEVEGKKP